MKGKIDMAARRQVTNKLRTRYRRATKAEKGRILDRVVDTTGMGRSTARRCCPAPDSRSRPSGSMGAHLRPQKLQRRRRHLDTEALKPSINRLAKAK